MKTAMLLILLAASALAGADGYAYLGAWSQHPNSKGNVNESHNLLAYELKGVSVGTFVNSFGDRSYIATIEAASVTMGDFEARALVGVVYGYRECGKSQPEPSRHEYGPMPAVKEGPKLYCPAVIPEISYTGYRIQPSLILLGPAPALTFKVAF